MPKVVIVVHFAGQPADMAAIKLLSKQYNFYIIEDASHALGAYYRKHKVGSCKYSDLTVFSFHPVKIITACEGGIVTTNQSRLSDRIKLLRNHGITRDSKLFEQQPNMPKPCYYEQHILGFNYRLSDIHASLGSSQCQRIDDYNQKRVVIAQRYDKLLKPLPVVTSNIRSDRYSALHLYVVRLIEESHIQNKDRIIEKLHNQGIGVNVHYIPIHLQPYYQRFGFKIGQFPNAERFYQTAISLPLFPNLTENDQNFVVQKFAEILNQT